MFGDRCQTAVVPASVRQPPVPLSCPRPRCFADGKIFDNTYKRSRPLKFKLRCEQVVPGWDAGVAQLSLGEMATVRMSAKAAWGKTGIPGMIPPNSDLEFEVELIGVQ
eukprot:COSAG01_NODE_9920_length_2302_cov_1.243759_3_plen_108_part_00